ncbi:MAG: type IV pilus secretin family protein, partial [Gammaproteobacteria bacterium]
MKKPDNHPIAASLALRPVRHLSVLLAGLVLFALAQLARAANVLEDIQVGSLPGNKVQIVLKLKHPLDKPPLSFTIDHPARIALDLADTRSRLPKKPRPIGIGLAESIRAVEAGGRTRVVLNLVRPTPYELRVDGNRLLLTLKETAVAAAKGATPGGTAASAPRVTNVDFRRGDKGQGRILIRLSDPTVPVDLHQEAGKVVVDIFNVNLPQALSRRLDVTDFATPVKTIDTVQRGANVHMVVDVAGKYDYVGYQTGNLYTVEIKPVSREEQEARRRARVGYTGERLSLNFQDIEVRSVLQLIADFTGLNIVVSDSVTGHITLRLQNVPWDQALDIILKTKGLAKRRNGNVILVAPSEELAAREKLELQSRKQIEELAPLYSEYIQVNYAKAEDIAQLIMGRSVQGKGGATNGGQAVSLLSKR